MNERFLEHQAITGAVFADDAPMRPAGLFGDIMFTTDRPGQVFALTGVTLGTLNNAQLTVLIDGVIGLQTTTATTYVWDNWTVLVARDTARHSSIRLILLTSMISVVGWPGGAIPLVQRCVRVLTPTITSLNGLTGAVALQIQRFIKPTYPAASQVLLTGDDPALRYQCPANPCAGKVYTVNGSSPNASGQLQLQSDDCFKLVPSPVTANALAWRNDCIPCCNCVELFQVHDQLHAQADYMNQLSAIFHYQFNAYQVEVDKLRQQYCEAQYSLTGCTGTVFVSARAIDRPYYNQLSVCIVNETSCSQAFTVSATMSPGGLAAQYEALQSTYQAGFGTDAGDHKQIQNLSGPVTVGPGGTLVVSLERHRIAVDATYGPFASGTWNVTVAGNFAGGNVNMSVGFNALGATPTSAPAVP